MNYNYIAPFYEFLSRTVFGKALIKSQSHFIKDIPKAAHVLIIGGGAGKFLPELLKNQNCKKVLYLESSSEMLRLSKKTISDLNYLPEIEFRLGTEDNLLEEERFNTIITFCFLDLYPENDLNKLILKLNNLLVEGGMWLVVDFRISLHPFHKIWQFLMIKIMYLFFHLTTGIMNSQLVKFEDCFLKNNYKCSAIKYFYKGMIFSAIYKK